MKSYILRGWFYYRVGQSAYISLVLGLVSFLLLGTLYLHTFLPEFHFWELAVLVLVPDTILAVLIGFVHTKKQLTTDNSIATVQNPFLYTILPGKEAKVFVPMMILNMKSQRKYLEKENLLDTELAREFDRVEEGLTSLLSGRKIQ